MVKKSLYHQGYIEGIQGKITNLLPNHLFRRNQAHSSKKEKELLISN